MRFKLITCQVLTREMNQVVSGSPHSIEIEILPMGLHNLGQEMRPHLQEKIDAVDAEGYDAILLGYALCGRGTDGLRAGKTQLVLPRAHDCIALLMGSCSAYQKYFEDHSGVYYRSPGWVEFQTPGLEIEPAFASSKNKGPKSKLGENRTLAEFVEQYGEDNGKFLFEQFNNFRRHYSGLSYISMPVEGNEDFRARAQAEAAKQNWTFDEVPGTLALLQRFVAGQWDAAEFLVVAPGATIHASIGDAIVEAE